MSHSKKEILSGIAFLLIAIVLYAGSYSIVVTTNDAMGPQFFPRTVAILMGIISIMQIISGLKDRGEKYPESDGPACKGRAVATIGILVLYAVTVQKIGFVIMTAVYLIVQILLLLPEKHLKSRKSIAVTILIAILVPIFIYTLFYRVFNIFLPAGLLG